MTTKELYFKYKEIFILVMESVAETKNPAYKDVERIINEREKDFLSAIDQGAPFDIVVFNMIAVLVVEIHGLDKVDNTEITEYMVPIFDLYLKKPTRTFCSQNGVPVITKMNYNTFVKRVLKDGQD